MTSRVTCPRQNPSRMRRLHGSIMTINPEYASALSMRPERKASWRLRLLATRRAYRRSVTIPMRCVRDKTFFHAGCVSCVTTLSLVNFQKTVCVVP